MKKTLSNCLLAGALFLSALAFASLAACGGGGSSDSNVAQNTGSVGIMLTDGPTDDFDQIKLEIEKIELLGTGPRISIFEGTGKSDEEKTVDLLDLANHSELFSLKSGIPAGFYSKIRLTLAEKGLALVKLNPDGSPQDTVYPKLPGNRKLDLNPRGQFEIVAGGTSYLQVDLDAEKSIHVSNGYQFRPVVFVDVLHSGLPGKLVKVEGFVTKVDQSQSKLVLCTESPEQSSEDDDFEGCTKVYFSEASIFNDEADLTDSEQITLGSKLTAAGFILFDDDDDHSSDDEDHTPSKLKAEVLELGGAEAFQVVKGPVKRSPANALDTFTLADTSTTEVTVALQEGTRIFSRTGQRLDFDDIQPDKVAAVDGVLSSEPDGPFKSALVILGNLPSPDKIQGTVQGADPAKQTLTLSIEGASKTIVINEKTLFFRISEQVDGMLSTHASLEDLQPGQAVDVYGSEEGDNFVAQVVLWEE